MNILFTGFNGRTNSSKILLDLIKSNNKLYLKNSFITSVDQLIKQINKNNYDLIVSFGQAPLEKNHIKIETTANGENKYIASYNFLKLESMLKLNGLKTIVSDDAGNYLCNNIYYHGLKYIKQNDLKTKMIFIHIPQIDNISEIKELANIFNKERNLNEQKNSYN